MWKQKLGISLGNHYKIPSYKVIELMRGAGIDAISPEWDESADLAQTVKAAKDNEMILQSLHAPYGGSAKMWDKDKSVSSAVLTELLRALNDSAEYEIPILVVHTWIGFDNTPEPTSAGLNNYGLLVERATDMGVTIAFENTEGDEHLFALMNEFENVASVGFCWDSGHEMCYNHSADLLKKFGKKLVMTHLNDNLGISSFDGTTYWTDDLHLLPFDGVADWNFNIERMKKARKQEILNFELNTDSKPGRHDNDLYGKMTNEEYFAEAYKRACKIAYRYSNL